MYIKHVRSFDTVHSSFVQAHRPCTQTINSKTIDEHFFIFLFFSCCLRPSHPPLHSIAEMKVFFSANLSTMFLVCALFFYLYLALLIVDLCLLSCVPIHCRVAIVNRIVADQNFARLLKATTTTKIKKNRNQIKSTKEW